MVRHKNRWLLVKIELAEDIRTSKSKSKSNPTSSSRRNSNGNSNRNSNGDDKNSSFPSRNEFATRLRRTMAYCYGIASGEGPSVNVRFCDATTQLALVRVPRDDCDIVRSSLTLLLTKKQLKSVRDNSGNSNSGNGNGDNNDETTTMSDYCASVRSVHGSARTARIAAMRALREWYRAEIRNSRNENETESENDQTTDDENHNHNQNNNQNNNEQLQLQQQQQQQQRKSETRLCRGLQERLIQIQNCVN